MDKMLAPNKALLAVFTLLATLASAAQAQVIESIYMEEPERYWPFQFGPEPYEFFGSEKKSLVALAARTASPVAPLLNLNAYHAYIEGRRGYRDVPRADLLFGPFDQRDNTFSLDTVVCTQNRYQWNCEPKDTWTYLYAEERNAMVSFGGDVTPEIAQMIATHEDSYCPLPRIEKAKRGDRDVVLSTHHISLDKKTGEYDRSNDSCGVKFRIKDGGIVLVGSYGILR